MWSGAVMLWKADIYFSAVLKFATIQSKPKNFGKPVINGKGFIYSGILEMGFTF